MGRPKGSKTETKETNEEIAERIKKSGALSPALCAALDEVTAQYSALSVELKKTAKQFKALTKL
jgi:hypothetical protein